MVPQGDEKRKGTPVGVKAKKGKSQNRLGVEAVWQTIKKNNAINLCKGYFLDLPIILRHPSFSNSPISPVLNHRLPSSS